MKKLFALVLILAGMTFGQTYKTNTADGLDVFFKNSFTLSSSATVYSDVIPMAGYIEFDSTQVIPIRYSASDSCQATISIEGKAVNGSNSSGWTPIATVVTNFLPTLDSLTAKVLIPVGTAPATALSGKGVSLAGFYPDIIRIKVAYTNKTTLGTGGDLKIWLKLKKL